MAGRGKLGSNYEKSYAQVPRGYINEAMELLSKLFKKTKIP